MKWLCNIFGHRWQTRATNVYFNPMYQKCLTCKTHQERTNKSWEDDKFQKCEPMPEFDNQFDKNNNYIFDRN